MGWKKGDPNHPRRGKGAGKWGPARGMNTYSTENQPDRVSKIVGHTVAEEIKAKIAARKDEILEAQLARATDIEHPQGHQAAADLLNRVMPPESKVQTDVTARYVVRAPEKVETTEEWLAKHKPQS